MERLLESIENNKKRVIEEHDKYVQNLIDKIIQALDNNENRIDLGFYQKSEDIYKLRAIVYSINELLKEQIYRFRLFIDKRLCNRISFYIKIVYLKSIFKYCEVYEDTDESLFLCLLDINDSKDYSNSSEESSDNSDSSEESSDN